LRHTVLKLRGHATRKPWLDRFVQTGRWLND
jgi:hypothetical protein